MLALRFAEIHFHLLPGVDDGPPTLEETACLARDAASEGTRTIVATPHVNTASGLDVSTIAERVRQVAGRLRRERIPVTVLAGGELAPNVVDRLSQRELECIAQGPPGRRWLLLEAPLTGINATFTAVADELRQRSFGIVVAHPERALAASRAGWHAIEHELRAGSAMQVNAWSVAGLNGARARTEALHVMRATRCVAVSSDAHGPGRAPSLRLAMDALAGLGERNPGRLTSAIPRKLLADGLPAGPVAVAA
jgi:protein-tyrosine phosphatase